VSEEKVHQTEPLQCWQEAKYLRKKYYEDFLKAKEMGGLRVSGSAIMFYCVPEGLGDDVYYLTGEPYAAGVANHTEFSDRCLEAVERAGIAHDLCSYLRNYWGSMILDKYLLADGTIVDGWPKPDFYWSAHICCSHAKWYQFCSEYEGGVPFYGIDRGMSYSPGNPKAKDYWIDYIVEQLNDGIDWMVKVTGREYNDELLIEAAKNEVRSNSLWPEICMLQQAVPAPMDEKTMFSLYLFNSMCPQKKEIVDFYERVRDEVADRVKRGIGAAPVEKLRIMTDSQPPWSFLGVWRYLEKEYGVVSMGSLYTFMLQTMWEQDEDGNFIPARTLDKMGIEPKNREEALRAIAERRINADIAVVTLGGRIDRKNEIMTKMAKDWHINAAIIHLNRGCEGSAFGQMENRLALMDAGIPVLTYEGSMGDARDFDLPRTVARIDAWLEGMGIKRLKAS
jgi:benzoyl-CoA reductase subunit B